MRATHPFGFLVAIALALTGCGASKEEAVRFNNTLAESDKRFVTAAQEFLKAANLAVTGSVGEVTMARRAYENVAEAVERMRSEARGLKIPKGKTSQAFYDAHMAVIAQREELVKEDFRIIMKVLEDPLLTVQERNRKLTPSARYLNNLDHAAERQLKVAQAAFISEYDIQLKRP